MEAQTRVPAHDTAPIVRSYLLRLWHVEGGVWRASIENIHTRERHLLADVELLTLFFDDELYAKPGAACEVEALDETGGNTSSL